MKVLLINRFFYPDEAATAQLASDLAFYLVESGLEVHVVTGMHGYERSAIPLPRYERIRGIFIHRVKSSKFGRQRLGSRAVDYLTFYVSATWRLFLLVGRSDTVIAMTDPPMMSVLAALVAYFKRARLINWLQDVFPEVGAALGVSILKGMPGRLLCELRNLSLRFASRNVVLGEIMARNIAAKGISDDRIVVIHNWADDREIRPIQRTENPLRRKWGLDCKFVVGYSGNFGRAHEFTTILDTADSLRDRPHIAFLMIGSGAHLMAIKDQVKRRGLENFVFEPYQPRDRLMLSLGAADLHLISLLPELEGMIVPSKFYGIAAAGRPIALIGDADGEIGCIVRDHGCGEAFRVGDSSSLRQFILTLSGDPSLVARLGARARMALDNSFSREKALALWRRTVLS